MLSLQEIQGLMSRLENWSLEGNMIVKEFTFEDFKGALEFVNKVGAAAERLEHHPDVILQYGKVRLSLSTHSSGGLTEKDFSLAEEIDKL